MGLKLAKTLQDTAFEHCHELLIVAKSVYILLEFICLLTILYSVYTT